MTLSNDLSRGGGVAQKVRIRGPQQERWIRMLARIDEGEVKSAVRALVREAKGNVPNIARYLDVKIEFLRSFVEGMRGLSGEPSFRAHPEHGPFPAYRTPTDAREIVAIIGAIGGRGNGRSGGGTGAWRIYDLLADKRAAVNDAALRAVKLVIADCQTMGEVAEKLGVTRMLLWRWRQQLPALDAAVREKDAAEHYRTVKLRLNGQRRLTLDEMIAIVGPHLPGTPTEVADRVAGAAREGTAPHGVVPTRREIFHYLGKPGSDGRMMVRVIERRDDKVRRIWTMIDTTKGERLDQRPPRKGYHCSLCGGSGHNRIGCPKKGKKKDDAEKKTDAQPGQLGRLRRGSGAASSGDSKKRRTTRA